MRFILASISLGFFSWASYMVLTGRVPAAEGGASPLPPLDTVVAQSNEAMGIGPTAFALLALGAVLSFGIIAFGPQSEA